MAVYYFHARPPLHYIWYKWDPVRLSSAMSQFDYQHYGPSEEIRPIALKVHRSKQEVSTQRHEVQSQATKSTPTDTTQKSGMNKIITSRKQILSSYPDIFEGVCRFPGPQYYRQVNPNVTPKQTLCQPISIHLKEAFKKEIDQMFQAGIIKPVQEATPWINSFILIKGKDKSGNPKLCICLYPMNLNKAVVWEPYHFKSPEDIAHLIADSCIMMVCDCRKGYWHQELDEASSFLITFNTKLGRFWYTVMPFGITMAGDVFQQKLDQCVSHLKNVIVIADDIMNIRKKQNHCDNDLALTALLETARRCNVWLNYDTL